MGLGGTIDREIDPWRFLQVKCHQLHPYLEHFLNSVAQRISLRLFRLR